MDMEEAARIEMRAMRSAWRTLCARWQLSDREIRELLPSGGFDEDAPPSDTERRMRLLIEISYRLPAGVDDIYDWLRTGTPAFAWHSPLEAMGLSVGSLRGVRLAVEEGRLS